MTELIKDTYQTISTPSEGLFKDKGSKFIAYAYPIFSVEEVKPIIDVLKKEHYSARHHCFAYRIGVEGEQFRANDDGEPSGSAGKPILGQLLSKDLTNILVVVVRYFGGTLLGVPGLINAYKKSTIDVIDNSDVVERIVEDLVEVKFDYLVMNDVMKVIKDTDLKQLSSAYDLMCKIVLPVRKTKTKEVVDRLSKIESAIVEIIGVR
ncbi:YigZ family protein [Halosquirtibacter xylanolyticus]|uniref:IMPACT family protein n=1 Tax=Halosquirtibacter xylanolyticus TaxID=3374599 RepID=UPI003748CFF0|nr:YigZ family protein [Prolixibacteraceae bacterium]